jgi:hypothetical protein
MTGPMRDHRSSIETLFLRPEFRAGLGGGRMKRSRELLRRQTRQIFEHRVLLLQCVDLSGQGLSEFRHDA